MLKNNVSYTTYLHAEIGETHLFILTQLTEKKIKSDLLKLRTAVDPRTTLTPGVDLLSV